ncbi:MAG: hypothetical protein NVSMB64_22010 [Candidatus Velthaea sp.]
MESLAARLIGSRERKITFVATVIATAFIANCFYYYFWSFYGHAAYPYNTFLVNGLFGDFSGSASAWRGGQFNAVGYGMAYFPSTFLFMAPLFNLFEVTAGQWIFAVIILAVILIYTFLNVRTDTIMGSVRDMVIFGLMSYPVHFEIVTGNLEGVLFIFLVLFIYFYAQGKPTLAAVFLAAAASMKLFPAVFLVLFIKDRRWRGFGWCIAFIVIFSIVPLLIFPGGILGPDGIVGFWNRFSKSVGMYSDLMIFSIAGMHYGHSLLNGWEAAMAPFPLNVHAISKPYAVFAGITFLLLAAYVVRVEQVLWRSVAILALSMCLLPYTSTDYKLLDLMIPMYLFLNYRTEHSEGSFDLIVASLFALLMISKTPFYVWGNGWGSMNVILNPLIMVAIIATIVWAGFRRRQADCVSLMVLTGHPQAPVLGDV